MISKFNLINISLCQKNIYTELFYKKSFNVFVFFIFFIVSVPVDKSIDVLKRVLNNVSKETLVIDVGSTKQKICSELKNHINRKNFLAMHPISGTENSGPYSAKKNLYFNITNIICEPELTSPDILNFAYSLFIKFNMKIINMFGKTIFVAFLTISINIQGQDEQSVFEEVI